MMADGGIGPKAYQRAEGRPFCPQLLVDRAHSGSDLQLRHALLYETAETAHGLVI